METITEFRDCQYAAARFQNERSKGSETFQVYKSYYPFGCNFEQILWNKEIIFNTYLSGRRNANIRPICRKGK